MLTTPWCRRVVLVVLDGLRPDAIDTLQLPNLLSLEEHGAWTHRAQTVLPPVTAAAMGSLLTGVHPPDHGLTSDRFHVPRSRAELKPLPALLRESGFLTSAFLAQPPLLFRRLARSLAVRLGVDRPTFSGQTAAQIVSAASESLARQQTGLVLIHLPDGDRAGHAHGWMSAPYCHAARQLDAAAGDIAALAHEVPDTLLIVCADHGGGAIVATDHFADHPLDRNIPIILTGDAVVPGTDLDDAEIVDIPPTILAALGLTIPAGYAGRVLHAAFAREEALAS